MLVFPYFMEQHVSSALPSLNMCDYQVGMGKLRERRKSVMVCVQELPLKVSSFLSTHPSSLPPPNIVTGDL